MIRASAHLRISSMPELCSLAAGGRCTFVASLERSCRALRQADVEPGRTTVLSDVIMTTSDPLAASTTAAQMRASVEGFIAGQGTAMLIGAVVVWAVILWLTACVGRLPPLWLTLAAGGAASRCACALLVRR